MPTNKKAKDSKLMAGLSNLINADKKVDRKPSVIIDKKEEVAKRGRKKHLSKDVVYKLTTCRIEKSLRDKMKIALVEHQDSFPTQDLFINYAIQVALEQLPEAAES